MDEKTRILVGRACAGDRQAAAEVASLFGPEVFRLARCLLRSEEEAKDAASDIFVKIYASPGIIPAEGFRPWLMKVTYNHCRDILRRWKVLNRLLPGIYRKHTAPQGPTPEQAAVETADQEEVRRAVAGLPEQEKVIVFLRYYQQLSYAEIGEVLDIPESTVGTRLHRAREKLRKMLAGNWGGV